MGYFFSVDATASLYERHVADRESKGDTGADEMTCLRTAQTFEMLHFADKSYPWLVAVLLLVACEGSSRLCDMLYEPRLSQRAVGQEEEEIGRAHV